MLSHVWKSLNFNIWLQQAPSASENENLEVELPSPSNNKPIVRTEPCVPSMLRCRGDPSSVRTHSHGRGPRRGGRYRPVTEELGNLSLCADETKNTKFSAEVQLSNANRDVKKDTNQLETTAQAQVSSGPKTEPEQGARGRKRGLHYHSRFHWDGRGSRSRGGPHHNQCHRGGRDHRRGYQHRPMERDRNREEVLWQRANSCVCASINTRLKSSRRNSKWCVDCCVWSSTCSLPCTFTHAHVTNRCSWCLLWCHMNQINYLLNLFNVRLSYCVLNFTEKTALNIQTPTTLRII